MHRRGFLGTLAAFVVAPFVCRAEPVDDPFARVWPSYLQSLEPSQLVPRLSDDGLYFFARNGVYRVSASESGAIKLTDFTSPAR